MVDWRDPEVMLMQAGAMSKVIHVMDGIYIWDFLSTCRYEFALLRGTISFRWTVWLYLGCRFFTLAEVAADLAGFNISTRFNCRLWVILIDVFAYTASSLAMALYGIRTIAIWKREPYVVALIAVLLTINVALWIRTTIQMKATWDATYSTCIFVNTEVAFASIMSTLASHVVLLTTMVVGIMRHKPRLRSLIGRFQREGVWWLSMSTTVLIVCSTFLALNLNDVMNLMFQTPTLICITIGATRIFRSIYAGYSGDLFQYLETSVDNRGKVHFRRRRVSGPGSMPDLNLPLDDIRADELQERNRFVERFDAREIKFDEGGRDSCFGITEPDVKSADLPDRA
ncbi:hypothetical protein PENSPDRAFT_752500 [Peniophora sp. CONT]|nr:hypothetical protein PENSPDRAFT_752500 [Peniophora sp. CONT]